MKHKSSFYKITFIVFFPVFIIIVGLIYFYKACISPIFRHTCRYTPSCSTYFLQALFEYGLFKGFFLGTKRIFKCNPYFEGGVDYLKPDVKGKIKWIL